MCRRVAALTVAVVTWSALMTSLSGQELVERSVESHAKRLYDNMLLEKSGYNKLIRPVDNTSESLTVHIGLRLTSIIDVVSRRCLHISRFTSRQKPNTVTPSRVLRSTNSYLFAVSSCSKCSFAFQAFCVSSPNYWNSLPLRIRSSDSLATFQSHLKTHLFASAYHV